MICYILNILQLKCVTSVMCKILTALGLNYVVTVMSYSLMCCICNMLHLKCINLKCDAFTIIFTS